MQASSLAPRVANAWVPKRECAHILRSDSAGLTLYANLVDAIAPNRPPHRAIYTLAYEAEGPNGEQLQYWIAETDSADVAQELVKFIERYIAQIRRTVARMLSGETSTSTLADYGNIHAESTREAVLAQLQALASHPLPECAYEGFVHAVCSSLDAWLSDGAQIQCDWVQQRTMRPTPRHPPR